MRLRFVSAALALIPALCWAQLSPNTVTVTASSSPTTQLDQAVFSVSVFAGVDQSLDDIVKALSGSGITAANLIGVSASSPPANALPPPPAIWTFQLAVPIANAQTETASLIALQKSIQQNNSELSLSFTLQNAQTSPQQFQSCDLTGLIASARTQAQSLAGAAGMTPTSIVSLQSVTSQPASAACSLTATFALGFSPQPGPHALTIVASRTVTAQPDQVAITITVTSSLTAALNDVTSAIASAGISGATFFGVSTVTVYSPLANGQSNLQWSFSVTASLAALKDTFAQLSAAQQTLSKQNTGLSLTFSVGGLQVSPQSQPVCSQASLISDATAQAQRVATAASLSAGPILTMSSLPSSAINELGDFSGSVGYASFLIGQVVSNPTTTCTLAVQFQLG